MMRLHLTFPLVTAVAAGLIAAPSAHADSNGPLGEYCNSRGSTTTGPDGATLYCDPMWGTEGAMWARLPGKVMPTPLEYPGTPCDKYGDAAHDQNGNSLRCSDGNYSTFMWQPSALGPPVS